MIFLLQELSAEYPDVVFLKVDVDECEDIATDYNISAMPTFVFIKNKQKVCVVVLDLVQTPLNFDFDKFSIFRLSPSLEPTMTHSRRKFLTLSK